MTSKQMAKITVMIPKRTSLDSFLMQNHKLVVLSHIVILVKKTKTTALKTSFMMIKISKNVKITILVGIFVTYLKLKTQF